MIRRHARDDAARPGRTGSNVDVSSQGNALMVAELHSVLVSPAQQSQEQLTCARQMQAQGGHGHDLALAFCLSPPNQTGACNELLLLLRT